MKESIDYYRVLGLDRRAGAHEIQRAYRSLARRYHPDRNPDAGAARRMTLVNEAYACLRDRERRQAYDRALMLTEPAALQEAVVDAARERLLGSGWRRIRVEGNELVFERKPRRVLVRLTRGLSLPDLDAIVRGLEGMLRSGAADVAVVLAFRVLASGVEPRLARLPRPAVLIDLTESRIRWGEFPDPACRELFGPFFVP